MAVKRIIADVNDEVSKLNPILSGVVQSTGQMKQDLNDALTSVKAIKDVAKDIKMPKANAIAIAGDAGEAKNVMNTFDPSPNVSTIVAQTKDGARQTDYSANGGGGGYTPGQGKDSYSGPDWQGYGGWKTGGGGTGALRAVGSAAKTALLGSAAALGQSTDVTNYVTNEVSRRRFGFFSGAPGTDAGAKAFQNLMNAGTASYSLDAAEAAMAGASAGMLPGLKNYKDIIKSVAGVSNIIPGQGLTASMGAVVALNQASSVNKLRMIGIQVRDQKGYMRGVEDIAKDLWNMLNKSKSGKGGITAEDLSYSLQSGMSLDSLLNQYFSGDPVLKDSIIAYLYQFASGHTTTKKGLLATGANPSISQSVAKRNAAAYGAENAVTNAGITGIEWANTQITNIANGIKDANGFVADVRDNAVNAAAALEVITGAGNGAVGTLMTTALVAGKTALEGIVFGSTSAIGNIAAGPGRLAALATSLGKIKNLGGIIAGTISLLGGNDDSANADTGGEVKFPVDSGGYANYDNGGETSAGWAKKLLGALDAPVTSVNVAALQEWMYHENTAGSGYLGTRNNPLNMLSDPGTGYGLGRDASGAQVYATEAQGIVATAKQLKIGQSQGYQTIVSMLQSGKATEEELWSAIAGSKWDEHRYGAAGTMRYNGATFNINISGAENMDPTSLANAIKNAIEQRN
jgi:hypothetical protein